MSCTQMMETRQGPGGALGGCCQQPVPYDSESSARAKASPGGVALALLKIESVGGCDSPDLDRPATDWRRKPAEIADATWRLRPHGHYWPGAGVLSRGATLK